jgi:hypothetical protein
MYKIREVDGRDEEVADALAELHCLTFFDGASVPDLTEATGGSPIKTRYRSLLPASCRQRAHTMRGISVASAY